MVTIKNRYGNVIAQVENPQEIIRDKNGEVADILPPDRTYDLDLSDLDLRDADFRGWDLSFANFSLSDLRGAVFREAGIHMANFFECELDGTNFENADLHASNILSNRCLNMDDINFEGASLPESHHYLHSC